MNTSDNDKPTIRSIIMKGLISGKNMQQIAEEIQHWHPDSAAAGKPAQHISWYMAVLKKEGVRVPKVKFFKFTSLDDLIEQLMPEPEIEPDEDDTDLED